MEHIAGIISAFANNWSALILIAIFAGLFFWGIKKGKININKGGIKIGGDERERSIIRNQWEYVHEAVEAERRNLPKNLNEDKMKYILSRVEDCFQQIIVYNHISEDESYIKVKQNIIYNNIVKRTTDPYFFTEDFHEYCNNFTKNLLKELLIIRKNGEK